MNDAQNSSVAFMTPYSQDNSKRRNLLGRCHTYSVQKWSRMTGWVDGKFEGLDNDIFYACVATLAHSADTAAKSEDEEAGVDVERYKHDYGRHLMMVGNRAADLVKGELWWWLLLLVVAFPHVAVVSFFSALIQLTRLAEQPSEGLGAAIAFFLGVGLIGSVAYLDKVIIGDLSGSPMGVTLLRWHYLFTCVEAAAIYSLSITVDPIPSFYGAVAVGFVHAILLPLVCLCLKIGR